MFMPLIKDVYKASHPVQYPKNTNRICSNMTARSRRYFNWTQPGMGYVVVFGIQAFIEEYLVKEWNKFFKMPKHIALHQYKSALQNIVGDVNLKYLDSLHDLGYLPIKVKALKEGTLCPIGVPFFVILNTHSDEEFGWVTNMLETLISCELWKPITVATISYEYKKLCNNFSDKTCDNNDHVQFQCHDFSMRGLSGVHDACVVGSAHLTSFVGSDTIPAIYRLIKYYNAEPTKELIGCSIPATEHSVMCINGQEGEEKIVHKLLTEVYPSGLFSAVLDGFDFFKVLTETLPKFKDIIMSREGKFVIRPDSGDPADIICGLATTGSIYHLTKGELDDVWGLDKYKHGDILICEEDYYYVYWGKEFDLILIKNKEDEIKGALELLWETFGGTINSKGYKVLDPHVGLIYGDSITLERANDIFERLEAKGFASSNIVFGVGSYTYQYITRDTFGIAIKATHAIVDGVSIDVQKDPATGDGTKKSLCGLIKVYEEDGVIKAKDKCSEEEFEEGLLQCVFEEGKTYNLTTLNEIRETLNK